MVYGIECSVCHHRSERQTKFSELEVTLIVRYLASYAVNRSDRVVTRCRRTASWRIGFGRVSRRNS